MKQTRLFITGTDTGVGKTVLTALMTQFLREQGISAAAFKPVCSGSRADARALRAAMSGALALNEINPWHFRAPIAPLLAARRENRRVKLSQVLKHVRTMASRFDVMLVEGAGGLFSPLGDDFDSRDLILDLRARPIIVCPNRLGAVNQVLLTLHALPQNGRNKTKVVLMAPPKPDSAARSNQPLLEELCGANRIFILPWLGDDLSITAALKKTDVRRVLDQLFR